MAMSGCNAEISSEKSESDSLNINITYQENFAESIWEWIDISQLFPEVQKFNLITSYNNEIVFTIDYSDTNSEYNPYRFDEVVIYSLDTNTFSRVGLLENTSLAEGAIFENDFYCAVSGPLENDSVYSIYRINLTDPTDSEILIDSIEVGSIHTSPNFERIGDRLLLRIADKSGRYSGIYQIKSKRLEKIFSFSDKETEILYNYNNALYGNDENTAFYSEDENGYYIALLNNSGDVSKIYPRPNYRISSFALDKYGLWICEVDSHNPGTSELRYIREGKESIIKSGRPLYRFRSDGCGVLASSGGNMRYLYSDEYGNAFVQDISRPDKKEKEDPPLFLAFNISEKHFAAQVSGRPSEVAIFHWQ